jgi:ATP-dependent protease HslVU (ClpYQ) ATPase subunit
MNQEQLKIDVDELKQRAADLCREHGIDEIELIAVRSEGDHFSTQAAVQYWME